MGFKSLAVASIIVSALGGAVGCGGGAGGGQPKTLDAGDKSGRKGIGGQEVSKAAAANFERGLDAFLDHDKKQDWNEGTCSAVADMFLDAAKEQSSATNSVLAEAVYNAGLAYQRCGNDAKAREQFEAAAKADPKFHRARAQIVLYNYAKSKDIEGTIRDLDQVIRDAKFQNVDALVSIAALQMERGGEQPDQDGKNDLERARKNLQRALAIDDGYMPAFNQLAIYYLEQAKAKAESKEEGARGGKKRRRLTIAASKKAEVNQQELDLAALVASQGVRKNANYAPLHNTAGLIQVELKDFNGAVKSFGRARALDPKFFEAHMNYAALNLSFRGFQEAEKAYRDALKLQPNEFEAHLGLALSLRGQINDANFDKYVTEAQQHLETCKKLEPNRAETYYNEAILTQEYRAKGSQDKSLPMLEQAAKQYREFVSKAGGDAAFADAVKRAQERTTDIEDTVKFIREGEAAKRAEEAAAKAAPPPAAPPPADAGKPAPDAGKPAGGSPPPGAKKQP
jgi:tetratricopeptide (TPR) repeat protein